MSSCNGNCSSCGSDCSDRKAESLLASLNPKSSVKKVIAVVSGKGGLDEVSPCGESLITILNEGKIIEKKVKVALTYGEEFGIDEIGGGDAQVNAKLLRAVLDGSDRGARRAVAIENAATAIMVAGLTDDFKRAISIAAESIDSGKALEKLELMTGAK